MDILKEITRRRDQKGWTEYELSKRADLPQSTISSWYNKGMTPSIVSLEKICNGFGITMSRFFAGEDGTFTLTEEQREFLDRFDRLSAEKKQRLSDYMKGIAQD